MPVITIKDQNKIIQCEQKENLLRVLLEHHIFVDNPCNGKGKCKKCTVRIWKGEQYEEVLSCLYEVDHDIEVEMIKKEKKHKVLTEGYLPEFEKEERKEGFGAAIDIGTTTVVCSLIDLSTGKEVAASSMINAQKHYGLDVLTRITYEYENQETGIQQLQTTIVDSVNQMLNDACKKADRSVDHIVEIDVAANCTMTHMLLGVDARSLGRAPYKPQFTDAQKIMASSIGIKASKNAVLYCLPQVSAYIGADIVAGAYVCDLHHKKGNTLFIDIGTNGEIILSVRGELYSCSCAAGPALEGMNITSGMRAAEGAVEKITIKEDRLEIQTIGEEKAEGICGSGILSVVGELLKANLLKKSGAFIKKEKIPKEDFKYDLIRMNGTKREFLLQENPEIIVTQSDIRQVQLAKGAILSGFMALLEKAGIGMNDLDEVLIAGQFGAHLSADLLTGTGILPLEVENKIQYVGNTSKTGAYMALMSNKVKSEMEKLACNIHYMELAETENYERIFADCMIFPDHHN